MKIVPGRRILPSTEARQAAQEPGVKPDDWDDEIDGEWEGSEEYDD